MEEARSDIEDGATVAIGVSMDFASSARRLLIAMEHTTRDGMPKLLRELTYPAPACKNVHKIFTDMAVLDVVPEGIMFRGIYPVVSVEYIQSVTEPELLVSPDLKEIEF